MALRNKKEWRCWKPLRYLASCVLMMPCNCSSGGKSKSHCKSRAGGGASIPKKIEDQVLQGSTVTGTLYGYKRGKVVSLCIQEDPRGPLLLLLELAVPTQLLVHEMQSGLLRIALNCDKAYHSTANNEDCLGDLLLSEPMWRMYCNGRKVGFAKRRQPCDADRVVLHLMQSVTTGAGVIPLVNDEKLGKSQTSADEWDDELVYMRAAYKRVAGSSDSESFHMINPDGASHELSIFLFRSS